MFALYLVGVSQLLDDVVSMRNDPRAQLALDYWSKGEPLWKKLELDLTTGLKQVHRKQFQKLTDNPRNAARMSNKTFLMEAQQDLLRQVGTLPRVASLALDNLASRIRSEFQEDEAPFMQGYLAASTSVAFWD